MFLPCKREYPETHCFSFFRVPQDPVNILLPAILYCFQRHFFQLPCPLLLFVLLRFARSSLAQFIVVSEQLSLSFLQSQVIRSIIFQNLSLFFYGCSDSCKELSYVHSMYSIRVLEFDFKSCSIVDLDEGFAQRVYDMTGRENAQVRSQHVLTLSSILRKKVFGHNRNLACQTDLISLFCPLN
jgi:hypothetical protein